MGYDKAPPIIAAGGVVYRRTTEHTIEVLLIKKQGGYWSLPKGRIEAGETIEAAAVREVSEETGIIGTLEERLLQVTYNIMVKRQRRTKVVTYFLMQANGGTLRPERNEAIMHVVWFPLHAARRKLHRKRLKRVVKRAKRVLNK